jgi:hypothetical protein
VEVEDPIAKLIFIRCILMDDNTHTNTKSEEAFLKGKALIRNEQLLEDEVMALTDYLFDTNQLGIYTPQIYEHLGNSIALLTQIATCQWGCRNSGHDIEAILRRFCNATHAALRLMNAGLYEEALGQTRSTAEIVNLLEMFCLDKSNLEEWKKLSSKEQRKRFSPVRVRLAIQNYGEQPVVSEDLYSKLCEIGIHISLPSIYQSYEIDRALLVGGHFSIQGLIIVLNTLAQIVAPCLVFAGVLVEASKENMQTLIESSQSLLNVKRNIDLTNYESLLIEQKAQRIREAVNEKLLKSWPEVQELGEEAGDELIRKGKLDTGKMSEQEIRQAILEQAGNKLLENTRRDLQNEDFDWVENASKFAFEQKIASLMHMIEKAKRQIQNTQNSDHESVDKL